MKCTTFGFINITKRRLLHIEGGGYPTVLIIGFHKHLNMTNEQKRELAAKYLAKLAGEDTVIDDLSIKKVIDVMLAFSDEVDMSKMRIISTTYCAVCGLPRHPVLGAICANEKCPGRSTETREVNS